MHILHHLNSNESWNEPDIHRKQYDISGFSDQVVAIWMGKLEGNSPGHCPVGGHSYVKLVSRVGWDTLTDGHELRECVTGIYHACYNDSWPNTIL